MQPHKKHAHLARPAYGEFHRQEWAVLGTPCGAIQEHTASWIEALADTYRLGYVDADHAAGDSAEQIQPSSATGVYTDKISFHRLDFTGKGETFQRRQWLQACDAVLVNGNHFPARRQIVVLDTRKRESLSRKLDRLTDVALVLTRDATLTDYPFLAEHAGVQRAPVLALDDTAGIVGWLRQTLTEAVPPLYGLVLAGGKSQRMGEDKAQLDYHGQPQFAWVADLLQGLCERTYVSLRSAGQLDTGHPVIEDSFTGLGPYGAILSAFRTAPDAAWLTVACDLPLLDAAALRYLVDARDPSRLATAFHNPATGWPDPLVTIWEPRAYAQLLQFLSMGYSCPRKVLINTDIKLIDAPRADILRNANNPAERSAIAQLLAK